MMKRLLVRVGRESIDTIDQLRNFGKVETVSLLMNIFSVDINDIDIPKIKKLPGILKVENDDDGSLKPIAI